MAGAPEELQKRLDGAKWPSVFSSENFKEWIEWNFVKDIKNGDKGDVQYQPDHVHGVSADRLQKVLCEILDLSWKEIICPTSLEGRQKRVIAIRCYRQFVKLTYGEISNIFGVKPARISRIMANGELPFSDTIEHIGVMLRK